MNQRNKNNPTNSILEVCDNIQTESVLKAEIFEPCDTVQTTPNDFEACDIVQTKNGRGGARKNSGMKSSGIETVTMRIDKRLLNAVTTIKTKFKEGNLNLDDLLAKPAPQNDDAKLLKKIAKLERDKATMLKDTQECFFDLENTIGKLKASLIRSKETYALQLSNLKAGHKHEISTLQAALRLSQSASVTSNNSNGLDDKLRKRLIQALHPDKFQDAKAKAVNGELVQALNGLAK